MKEDGHNYIVLDDAGSTGDKNYWARTDTSTDNDKIVTYNYLTGYTGIWTTNASMQVNVKVSPYVMYLNPRAKTGANYYGTLYIPYKAAVPEGAKAYYASAITEHERLEMTQVPAGKAIPAHTPVYVEAEDGPGYYAFYEAAGGTDEATIGTNHLTGTLEQLTVGTKSVLTLGHNIAYGDDYDKLGFWTYSGTLIPAHRAYVSASTLASLGGSAKGLALQFGDDATTGLSTATSATAQPQVADGWYTLQGSRLTGRPTLPGIYINHGKKKAVR